MYEKHGYLFAYGKLAYSQVYTTVSLNWFMCYLQTFQKFNIQHKGMY